MACNLAPSPYISALVTLQSNGKSMLAGCHAGAGFGRLLRRSTATVNSTVHRRGTRCWGCGKGNDALLQDAPALTLLVCQFVEDAAPTGAR
jgi:hypothetical protein